MSEDDTIDTVNTQWTSAPSQPGSPEPGSPEPTTPKRRTRARKTVGTAADETGAGAPAVGPAEPAAGEDAPAAPRRRRATKKVAAAVTVAAAAVDAAEGAADPDRGSEPAAPAAASGGAPGATGAESDVPAAPAARRRRATKKASPEGANTPPSTVPAGVEVVPGADSGRLAVDIGKSAASGEPASPEAAPAAVTPAEVTSVAVTPTEVTSVAVTSAEPVRMKPLTPEALLAAVERQRRAAATASSVAAHAGEAPEVTSTAEVTQPLAEAETPEDAQTPEDAATSEDAAAPDEAMALEDADRRPAVFAPVFVAPEQQSRFTRRPERSERPTRSASRSGGGRRERGVPVADEAPSSAEDALDLHTLGDRVADEPVPGGVPFPGTEHSPVVDVIDEPGDHDDPEADVDSSAEESGARRKRRRRGGRGRRRVTDADADDEGSATTEGPGDGDGVGSVPVDAVTYADDTARSDLDSAGSVPADRTGTEVGSVVDDEAEEQADGSRRRRRRRRRGGSDAPEEDRAADGSPEEGGSAEGRSAEDTEGSSRVREPRRRRSREGGNASRESEATTSRGSTRLEAKRVRRKEGRDASRRRPPILTEAEFLARRESVARTMLVRERDGRTQIAVLEDDILVEHYIAENASNSERSMIGDVYLGRVQNVLPAMEAAFIDIGRGRNGVLYAGEVNWDGAGLDGKPKRIELALKSGQPVLVQVTKDPIGHKGARLTAQISLAGRYLVYVPNGSMSGISRKLPDVERARLKKILKDLIPSDAGVIVRTAAEGATEEELTGDVERLKGQWAAIQKKAKGSAPNMLQGEPDLAVKVVRDIFNSDFAELYVTGDVVRDEVVSYVQEIAPTLVDRVHPWSGPGDLFTEYRIDEQLVKALDRKVWLPSGGSLVIDRTEAMTVVDVNTGRFTGSGGNLEETVTENNLEAAEELVRQLRLRDIGGIIVVDFIDMVFEANRDLVIRRLVECLGRDRTKHQVAEVSSLGLVQMTRKRIGRGLLEVFGRTCETCKGRGVVVDLDGHEHSGQQDGAGGGVPTPSTAIPNPGNTGRLHQRKAVPGSGPVAETSAVAVDEVEAELIDVVEAELVEAGHPS